MISKDLQRHASRVLAKLQGNKWERNDEGGVFVPGYGHIMGRYRDDEGEEKNTLTFEGANYIMMAGLKQGPQEGGFYLALFENPYTPTRDLTAAQFPATAGEIVSATEGYTEPTRPKWLPADADQATMHNDANTAEFTIATDTELVVRGAALLSDPVKGSDSGVLISAARFNNPRRLYDAQPYRLAYEVFIEPV